MLKQYQALKNQGIQAAATFGWLCVETSKSVNLIKLAIAATFGWLCVETRVKERVNTINDSSHLRVAVC